MFTTKHFIWIGICILFILIMNHYAKKEDFTLQNACYFFMFICLLSETTKMMSELGRETVSAYAAAKGGLKMLTRNICSEYGEYNIQCNGIGPGYIATPQTAPLREKQPDGSRHPFDQFIVSKTPAARWGEPQDLMGPAVFLASDASNFVNGHVLYVDGGILAYIGKQPE